MSQSQKFTLKELVLFVLLLFFSVTGLVFSIYKVVTYVKHTLDKKEKLECRIQTLENNVRQLVDDYEERNFEELHTKQIRLFDSPTNCNL